MDEGARDERRAWGDAEGLAAYVRWLMAECRARLAAEDAARVLAHDGQEAEGNLAERPAAD